MLEGLVRRHQTPYSPAERAAARCDSTSSAAWASAAPIATSSFRSSLEAHVRRMQTHANQKVTASATRGSAGAAQASAAHTAIIVAQARGRCAMVALPGHTSSGTKRRATTTGQQWQLLAPSGLEPATTTAHAVVPNVQALAPRDVVRFAMQTASRVDRLAKGGEARQRCRSSAHDAMQPTAPETVKTHVAAQGPISCSRAAPTRRRRHRLYTVCVRPACRNEEVSSTQHRPCSSASPEKST